MKILLSGCTGFIGRHLTRELSLEGHEIVSLTRRTEYDGLFSARNVRYVTWNDGRHSGTTGPAAIISLIEETDAIVNLAGESIGKGRWTEARKKVLVDSRVKPTETIVSAVAESKKKPQVMVNASAVGYYGNVDEGEVPEGHPAGEGFLASLCVEWEQAAKRVEAHGVRLVLLRIAFVVGGEGSALGRIALPFRMFVGGPIGLGKQWFPWVHVADVAGVARFALSNDGLRGPVNVAAPETLTMKKFCSMLGRALGRPSWAPVPGFAVRLLVGELADMILGGQKVVPEALDRAGYRFTFPKLSEALDAIYRPDGSRRG
ncbi:MAG TPA: TIGR01777 family oxidoreductase [Bacteroidota bacterium]|nr:TIGR01777 family oxidoreductase [Bacteroidota bacterium]